MATTLENQPTVAAEHEHIEESLGDVPETKSGVRPDPNAPLPGARYKKGDIVHVAQISGGRRIKLTGEVHRLRNSQVGYVEYQLKNPLDGTLQGNGAWFREKDMNLQRAA